MLSSLLIITQILAESMKKLNKVYGDLGFCRSQWQISFKIKSVKKNGCQREILQDTWEI